MLEIFAPLLTGVVVGWIIFYFIRRYREFTPAALIGTLAALIGGDVLAFLIAMRDTFTEADFHLWYFVGAVAGFFLYGIYVLLVMIWKYKQKSGNGK